MNGDENKFPVEKPTGETVVNLPEADMEQLSRAVTEVQKQPEFKDAPPKEVIKQSLRVISNVSTQPSDDAGAKQDDAAFLPNYMQAAEPADKEELEALVQLSLDKGFEEGINEARKHGSFMVDAIHDALAEKVYPELKRRGILE
jgi:hypothetical protein